MRRTEGPRPEDLSRRGFLKGTGIGVAASGLIAATKEGVRESAGAPRATVLEKDKVHEISFTLNGKKTSAKVRTGHTLLETLRDQLDLTGAKLVCDSGTCGACTVLVDGRPVNSCLTLAVDAEGRSVETIEGLAKDGVLHPVQEAFVAEDALQCGFCTPGMIMTCKSLLDRNPSPTRHDCAEAISGNICRCGTYFNIFRAVDRAAKTMKGGR